MQHKAFKERLQYKTLKKRSCPSLSAGDKNRSPASRRFCVLFGSYRAFGCCVQHKVLRNACRTKLSRSNRAPAWARATKIALRRVVFAFVFGFLSGCSYRAIGCRVEHKAFKKETRETQGSQETTVLRLGAENENRATPSRRFCVFCLLFLPCVWSLRATQSCQEMRARQALKKRPCSCLSAGEENRANPSRCFCVSVWLVVSCCLPLRAGQSSNKTRATQFFEETTMLVPGGGQRKLPSPVASCLRFVLVGRIMSLVVACNTKLSRNACKTKLSRNDHARVWAGSMKIALPRCVVFTFVFNL